MPSHLTTILPGLCRWTSSVKGPQQPVNSYILRTGRRTVLIDPAADLSPEAVGGPVGDILVTHLQRENAAGCANFPGARVHVPEGDEYLAEGAEPYSRIVTPWPPPWEWETRGDYRGHLAGAPNERPPEMPIALAEPLRAGRRVVGCRVLATPGHGKHAVTLLADVEGKRIAFCGDLVCGDGRLWNWFDSEWDYGLQRGPRSLAASAARLARAKPDLLCPAHGPVVRRPAAALAKLRERLQAVLRDDAGAWAAPPFPEKDSPADGFREVLPCLHQWRTGNCSVLVSKSGRGLMVDDGLCYWQPLPERAQFHRAVITEMKRALGIERIEVVIPSHYHGDHTENIPELVEMDGARVVCLDTVAGPIEHPERYRVTCLLPWYGTAHDAITVDRRVEDGQRIRWREFDLEIFHLGGQTDYHLGVNVTIGGVRTLFVGDSMGGTTAACEPPLCYNAGEPEDGGWPYGIERMIERRPDLLVCGHGIVVAGPMPLLLRKRAAWKRRMRQFRALSFRKSLRLFFSPFLERSRKG